MPTYFRCISCFCVVLLSACVGKPFEPPMNQAMGEHVDLNKAFAGSTPEQDDELLLMASFSGGGTRAAALAYGVLKMLNEQTAERSAEQSLLDKLDYISAVSGGSFTAAYYALFGKRIFTDYRTKLLEKDLQAEIRHQFLTGDALRRISSEQYGVSDLLANYYDQEIFEQKTLADLLAVQGLVVDINAVDISRGTRFSFNKSQLRTICTDPASITVGRAVAASSAVPVVFSAISLRNYADQCQDAVPDWILQALEKSQNNSRRLNEARRILSYMKPGKRKYIHLLDGGLADNLGVRASIARTLTAGSLKQALDSRGLGHTSTIVYIVVDAANWPPVTMDETANHPPLESIISAATSAPIVQYNKETLNLLRQQFAQWSLDTGGKAYVIHLSFDKLPAARRETMLAMPTNLALTPEQVEEVIQAGRSLLQTHPEYTRWVSNIVGGAD